MKFLLITFLLLGNAACDHSTTNSPETGSENPEEPKITENSQENASEQSEASPGEIIFDIKILEAYKASKEICGISKSHVVLVEVLEVEEQGMDLINIPHKNQQLLVSFTSAPKDLEVDTTIKAKAKEALCPEASKTFYNIKSYQIL